MERGKITITENGMKISPANGTVWLSVWEIAKTFDVFPAKVNANIKSILKSDVLWEREVCCCEHYANGNSVDLYNLEMITALAFRIRSRNSEIFRRWLMKRACSNTHLIMKQLFSYFGFAQHKERKINLN